MHLHMHLRCTGYGRSSACQHLISCEQVFTAEIPALALEHADISDPSSVPVRLNARSGLAHAASVRDALAASSAGSSGDSLKARLGAASSRHLLARQVCACSH